jgi:hypothetical protein
MKDMFIGQDGMPRHPIKERLQHSLPSCYHLGILLRLRLFDSIVPNTLLGRYGWDDERWVELR